MPDEPLEGQPAFALWTRLDAVRNHPNSDTWPVAWQVALGTNSPEETQEGLIELASLYRETVQLVRSTTTRPENLLHHAPDWRHAITLDIAAHGQPICASGFELSVSATSALYTVAEFLHRTTRVPHSADARRQSIAEALEALRVALDEANDLPEQLLIYARARVGDVSRALRNYGLTGDLPLVEAAEKLTGDSVAQPELWSQLAKSSVGKKFLKVVAYVVIATHGYADFSGDVATSIENTQTIVQSIQEFGPKAIEQGSAPRELEAGDRASQPDGPTALPPGDDGDDATAGDAPGP